MAIQDFTVGQVLTAAQMDSLQANDYNQTVSTKTADYTLVAADKGTRVVMNAAGATTITVNDSLFSAGDTVVLQNIGAGVSTVTAGTATVSSAGPLAIPQYGSGTLYFTSAGVSIYFPSAVTVSASGLTHIVTSTTTAATQTFDNIFSATYTNYKVVVRAGVASSTQELRLRFRTGGTTNTTSNYDFGLIRQFQGTVDSHYQDDTDFASLANNVATGFCFVDMTINNPFATESTLTTLVSKTENRSFAGGFIFDETTSFDGVEIYNAAGTTFTYTTSVYGLAIS